MIYLRDYRYSYATHKQSFENIRYPQSAYWFPDTYAKAKMGVFYPPHKMAEKILDATLIRNIRENPAEKTAFILAAGNTHFAGINPRKTLDNEFSYEYKFLPLTLTQVYAGRMAQAFGACDHVVTDASACASGLKVLMDVQTLIKFYGFTRVVVLAIEDQVNNSILDFFGEAQASLSLKEEKEGIVPSAFDSTNYGFNVGQGACLAIFESEKEILKSGVKPKARLLSAMTSSENCTNAIGQNENGEGFAKAIKETLSWGNLQPSDVKIIKTHGTGTKSNNLAEKTAIESIFDEFVATSYKPKIGHTMGTSGLLESCILLDDMGNGIIPKILNRTEEDNVYLSEDIEAKEKTFLSLSAGMGNVYSAAVFTTEI
jgi:3-oxoacyl-(acyl-carrier-protein) synthase